MKSKSEFSLDTNVENFEKLLAAVSGYGPAYNPANVALSVAQLGVFLTSARNIFEDYKSALASAKLTMDARELVFQHLNKYVTKIINAMVAFSLPDNVIDNARSIAKKIQGTRVSAIKTEEEIQAAEAEGKVVKQISSSQQGYDIRLSNFQLLLKLIEEIPEYNPNEEDLQVATLEAYYADLKNKNSDVATAIAALISARISRDNLLYAPKTGLVDIALTVKAYVKSLFGGTSDQYKQVAEIHFRSRKIIVQVPPGLYHAPTP